MATDACCTVAEEKGCINEMAEMDSSVRDTTDALNALSNATDATGKRFSSESAVLSEYSSLTALVKECYMSESPTLLLKGARTLRSCDKILPVATFVVASVLISVCLPLILAKFTILAVCGLFHA